MLHHLLDLIFDLSELKWTEFVKWSMDGWCLVFQIDLEFMTHPYPWHTSFLHPIDPSPGVHHYQSCFYCGHASNLHLQGWDVESFDHACTVDLNFLLPTSM